MIYVSDIVEYTHIVAGIFLNCLLLYAIRRFSKKALGTYKHLLTLFASFDIFLTTLHAAVKPVRQHVVIVGTSFGVAGVYDDRKITAIHFYTSCFTVPFVLINIHFIYRFWAIRRPELILLFSSKRFIAFISIFPIAEFVIWYAVSINVLTGEGPEIGKQLFRVEYALRYGKEQREGWLMMNHWENGIFNLRIFFAMFIFDLIMIVSFSIASILASMTLHYILSADKISANARNLQFKLFIAVCAQTFVPLFFVYIPYFCAITFPFFLLPIWIFDQYILLLTACFPAWDAVIIILLMKDYREGLIGMIIQKKPPPQPSVWSTTNVMAIAMPQ